MKALAIARRELAAYLRSPVAWIVATLFLAVQGYAFYLYVAFLDERGAPHAWPLRYFFGGSFLFWLFMMLVASTITMRLVAEERRLGTIEPLLTTDVSCASVIAGKYAAALAYYALLWAPTVAYVVLLDRLAPAGRGLDWGPVAAGYLGTLVVGAGALAVGLLASTVTQHQLVAVVLGFVSLLLLLLLGLAADAATPGSLAKHVLERLSLMAEMEDFGRGIVDTRALAYQASLALGALWASARLVDLGRQTRRDRARTAVEIAALAVVLVGANVIANRHWRRLDLSHARASTLAPRTDALLARLDVPVDVHVLMVPTGRPDDATPYVRDLLELYTARAPRLRVDFVDADREPERTKALAARYGMSGDDLLDGVVVFERPDDKGGRSRFVGKAELVDVAPDPDGTPRIVAFKGEAAFDAALLGLLSPRAPHVCFTRGHGELQPDDLSVDGAGDFGEALRRSNFVVERPASIAAGVPSSCDVTVVAGAERPFAAPEIDALEALLRRGGRLLVLAGPALGPDGRTLARTGLEDLAARWDAKLDDAIAMDPGVEMSAAAVAFAVDQGYGDHPSVRGFMGRRTVWALARPVHAMSSDKIRAVELVRTSERGFAVRDLDAVFHDPTQIAPPTGEGTPLPLAVAATNTNGARLVVAGSRAIARNDHDVYYNRDLLESFVRWLDGDADDLGIAPRTPSSLKLALDQAQLDRVFQVCVVGLPLLCVLLGLGVWWRRRQ